MGIEFKVWGQGTDSKPLWVDFTSLLAEYFTLHKNPLTRFDIAHLFHFYDSMSSLPAGVIIAYVDDEPAGMVMVETMPPRPTRPYGHEISRLYVKEEFRGKGMGRALMVEAFKRLEQSEKPIAFLLVDKGNMHAVQMYDAMGFTKNAQASQEGTEGVLYLEANVKTLLENASSPKKLERMWDRLQRLFANLRP